MLMKFQAKNTLCGTLVSLREKCFVIIYQTASCHTFVQYLAACLVNIHKADSFYKKSKHTAGCLILLCDIMPIVTFVERINLHVTRHHFKVLLSFVSSVIKIYTTPLAKLLIL